MLGRELSPEEGEQHAELVQAGKLEELDAWKKFDVFEPRRQGNVSKQVVHTRWVLEEVRPGFLHGRWFLT